MRVGYKGLDSDRAIILTRSISRASDQLEPNMNISFYIGVVACACINTRDMSTCLCNTVVARLSVAILKLSWKNRDLIRGRPLTG